MSTINFKTIDEKSLTVRMHGLIPIGIAWLALNLRLLIVLQLLLPARHHIWHDCINERKALHGPL